MGERAPLRGSVGQRLATLLYTFRLLTYLVILLHEVPLSVRWTTAGPRRYAIIPLVQTRRDCRQLVANSTTHRRRRRDSTVELRRVGVGVGGVNRIRN